MLNAVRRRGPRVTVAAIIEEDGRFLLVEEQTPEGLRLNNPAGHLEPGETPEQGVVREALEETARHFVPEALVGVYLSRFVRPATGEDVSYLRLAYRGRVGAALEGRALDRGIVRTLWLTADEIRAERARHRSPLVMRCIDDHLAGRAHPLSVVIADGSIAEPEIKQRARQGPRTRPDGSGAPAHPRPDVLVVDEPSPGVPDPSSGTPADAGMVDAGGLADAGGQTGAGGTDSAEGADRAGGVAAAAPGVAAPVEPTLAQTAAALAAHFPALFSPGAPRPIKLRIHADIQRRAPGRFTRKQLALFLHRHTTSTAYLRALAASTERFDLDGAPAGVVAAEHREAAAAEVERRRQIALQRRAGERAARRHTQREPRRAPPGSGDGARGGATWATADGATTDAPRAAADGTPATTVAAATTGVAEGATAMAATTTTAAPAATATSGAGPSSTARPARHDPGPRHADAPRGRRGDDDARRGHPRGAQDGRSSAAGPARAHPPARPPARPAARPSPPSQSRQPQRAPWQPNAAHGRQGDADRNDAAGRAAPFPDDPARRERALLLQAFENSPFAPASFCALKGLKLDEFETQIELARRERAERHKAAQRG